MNGILCFGGKRGCVPVSIPDLGPADAPGAQAEREQAARIALAQVDKGSAGEALAVKKRFGGGSHQPVSDVRSPAAPEPKLSPLPPFHPEPPASYWPPARTERSPNLVRIPGATVAENCSGAHCKARIYKVKHPKTGKLTPAAVAETIKLPKDGAIVPTGAFAPYLDAAPGRETIMRDGMGYSHFIDCPDAPQFKRK